MRTARMVVHLAHRSGWCGAGRTGVPVDDEARVPRGVRLRTGRRPAGGDRGALEGIDEGQRFQTLLGITGSGKSATIAWTIEQTQRPTLILAPNKSLAAQLARSSASSSPTTGSSTSSATTTTTSPRPTSRRATPTSRRTRRSTTRSTGSATRRHLGAAHPARRDRRRIGVVHLRPGQPRRVPQEPARPERRRRSTTSARSCAARRHAVRPQRHEPRAGQVPGARRHARGAPRLRRESVRIEFFGDEVESSPSSTR
jgi:hypothetical protein